MPDPQTSDMRHVKYGKYIYTFIRNECNTKREDKKRKTTMNTIAHND